MVANQDVFDFLRATAEHLKRIQQRTSDSWQDDAALIAGSRQAIARSQELLRDLLAS